jgi:lysophospholipase L1-like esterase
MLCLGLAAGAAAGALAGITFGFQRWRQAPSAAFHQVEAIVLARAADVEPGGIVVLGDSIVEQQQIAQLCGRPALNAGISGARVRHFIDLTPRILALARPSRVVVALGANDLRGPKATSPAQLERQFQQVLDAAGPRPIVMGVAGTGAEEINRRLSAVTHTQGGTFVAPLPVALTVDGVHPSSEGKREWRRRIEAACD